VPSDSLVYHGINTSPHVTVGMHSIGVGTNVGMKTKGVNPDTSRVCTNAIGLGIQATGISTLATVTNAGVGTDIKTQATGVGMHATKHDSSGNETLNTTICVGVTSSTGSKSGHEAKLELVMEQVDINNEKCTDEHPTTSESNSTTSETDSSSKYGSMSFGLEQNMVKNLYSEFNEYSTECILTSLTYFQEPIQKLLASKGLTCN